MKKDYDNDSMRRMRLDETMRPMIDSISRRVKFDSPAEERTYTLIELFPRDFIRVEKKKVMRNDAKNI